MAEVEYLRRLRDLQIGKCDELAEYLETKSHVAEMMRLERLLRGRLLLRRRLNIFGMAGALWPLGSARLFCPLCEGLRMHR